MIALLPSHGLTLRGLEASGQLGRLIRREFTAYGHAFAGALWCGYGSEAEDGNAAWYLPPDFRSVFRPARIPPRVWGALLPVARGRVLRTCAGMRVLGLTGALPAIIACRLWGLPFVLQVGYDAPAVARSHGKPLRARCLGWLRSLAIREATGVVFASPALHRASGGRAARSVVIPNGVDLSLWRPTWAGPSGERRVVYWGRLSREKGLLPLAVACQKVGATLHVIGDGPLRQALSAAGATSYGRVAHEDLPPLVSGMDAFCLPSETEGSPKSLLEALAIGLPCAASRPAWAALGHGRMGPTFTPGDVDGTAVALEEALADAGPWPLASAVGRALVESEFDLAVLLRREIAFVKEVLDA